MNKLNYIGHKTARRETRYIGRKTLLILALLLCVGTAKAQVLVKGSVFGGGEGDKDDEKAGMVKGNTTITITGGNVERSVYGGGEQGAVGTFTTTTITYDPDDPNGNENVQVEVPTTCTSGGVATVNISGGIVGRADHAFMPIPGTPLEGDDFGYVFCGGRGEVDTITHPRAIALGVVGSTSLNISGTALITASVYGGSENGLVLGNTSITMSGGQIGIGHYKEKVGENWVDHFDGLYTDAQWEAAIYAVQHATIGTSSYTNPFHECHAWPYNASNFLVYDPYYGSNVDPNDPSSALYQPTGAALYATDGHSFFGNMFGGGSGYYPYAPGQWRRTAGQVKGNTTITITGGHILTDVYGGNETTDVIGKATVNMSGGTIGVPRILDSIQKHPVTCYLFGGGMGDPRTYFNKWTNVNESEINITGGTIFGSVFGGGEEGHVLGDVEINIDETNPAKPTIIGTLGYSYVDGNIFGAGRGLSGMALTAGTVGGNVTMNIKKGSILGSVYGGGRLASVGTHFVPADNPLYGQFQEGDNHGCVTINISGGTIGNDNATDNALPHPHGGNVFGGSMGRLKDINNANYLPLWHRLARVKVTHVNITGGTIKNVVYGGSEYGSVRDSAVVVVDNASLYIRKVYGGGYGSDVRDAGYVSDSASYPALLAGRVEGNTIVKIKAGTIGTNVYGGGDLATVGVVKNGTLLKGNTHVVVSGGSIGTATNYTLTSPDIEIGHVYGGGQGIQHDFEDYKAYCNVNSTNVTIKGGNVYGSVFGGGPDSHVLGNTSVTLETGASIGTEGTTDWDGNVFGGGKGNTGSFTAGRVGGNTLINMKNGVLMGNIYGGGRFAQTGVDVNGAMQTGDSHGKTKVMVKGGTVGNPTKIETFTTFSMGNIYGGGKGLLWLDDTHQAPAESALLLGLTKNTEIIIKDSLNSGGTLVTRPHVYGIVLGGGELANVGKYTLTKDGEGNITNIAVTDGKTKVKISGGIIGGDRTQMRADTYATGSPWLKYNDDLGYVYGGGEGWSDDPTIYVSVQESSNPVVNTSLVDLIATVQSTEVEISGTAWVKASVFGGSESGHVRGNTKVRIIGGQIGAGYSTDTNGDVVDLLYSDSQFFNPLTTEVTDANSLSGTAHWPYGKVDPVSGETVYTPFDPAYLSQDNTPSDGKSWFGNVFGGGSGWFPYVTGKGTTGEPYVSHWNPLSGKVWGNTEVIIADSIDNTGHLVSRPHILNNVYGANESTDVGGKATIKISGGTIGVPRTPAQVALQPTICYVFGGGAGDPRTNFDGITNVASTDVQITGGIIYGSAFGGAEDGHVLGKVDLTVSPGAEFTVGTGTNAITYHYPVIGSTGKSGADGNIFCGGRNFLGDNLKSGRVEGNITLNMSGGVILGSIFGGGRYALTGIDVNGAMITTDPTLHGNTNITISGGVVGNRRDILAWLATPNHTTMGDVFASGKGHAKNPELGKVKNASVTITGTAQVLGSVFGGGEMANVGWYDSGTNSCLANTGDARVTISGGQVGIEQIETLQQNIVGGNVFGGGKGVPGNTETFTGSGTHTAIEYANVGNTLVTISGGYITNSVFGGAEDGHVITHTVINMSSGIVGQKNTLEDLMVDSDEQPIRDHIYTGSVLGGGRGTTPLTTTPTTTYSDMTGRVFGNATITISGGTVRHAVYGGGGLAHVGTSNSNDSDGLPIFESGTGTCTVTISGGHIGPTKADLTGYTDAQLNTFFKNLGGNAGWVFGAGCGLVGHSNLTFNDKSIVSISGDDTQIVGSVFGGGETAHVKSNTNVTVSGGTIGGIPLHSDGTVNVTSGAYSGINFTSDVDELAEDDYGAGRRVFRGNVYGGGKGNDFLDKTTKTYSTTAGVVYGNTNVTIEGGTIYNRVFGGGSMASVGVYNTTTVGAPDHTVDSITGLKSGGTATVLVKGGTIGTDGYNNGDVFGGGRGLVGRHWDKWHKYNDQVVFLAYVGNTNVTIQDGATIKSNVYGGSANGHVQQDARVTVTGGTIGIEGHGGWHSNVYGGGGGHHQYQKGSSTHHSITSGRVFGNTYVNISGGTIKHNVYGGGAIASVGTYNIYKPEQYVVGNTGNTTVTITGGTIGYNGNENGMVFGSGRGQIAPIDAFMDSLSYAVKTVVTIGTLNSSTGPMVHGSVYGSGENGHVYEKATVNVHSGTIGCESYNSAHSSYFANHGNVYGAGCGTDTYIEGGVAKYNPRSGMVWGNTEVNITGGHISRNVYGGGAMALVGTYTVGAGWTGGITGIAANTGKTIVNVSGGTIGTSNAPADVDHGNVYGGSRGPLNDNVNGFDDKAITDITNVFISGSANVLGSVYGGGEKSWTRTARVATVSGGTVKKNVFGGGKNGIDNTTPFTSLKTVNVRGGHIEGCVFGGSFKAVEGDDKDVWTSFVNITGGTIGYASNTNDVTPSGNVYAAGYGGEVDGSVCLNVGLTAVKNAPTFNPSVSTSANTHYQDGLSGDPTLAKVKIEGNLFDGSYQYQTQTGTNWLYDFDITGYSTMFIDGTGYDTEHSETTNNPNTDDPYMNIGGGIYGGGNYCESGKLGRKVVIRNYGKRVNNTDGSLSSVTRTLTTLQRSGIALIDNANIQFSGMPDLSQRYEDRDCFGVLTVDDGLYVTNGSSFVLGTDIKPAYMDSIKEIRSLHLKSGTSYSYINSLSEGNLTNWEWIGVNYNGTNTPENAHLYYTETNNTTALTYAQENVIIFNGDSRMWVRYKNASTSNKVIYGPLYGFFRVRANDFTPYGTKGFAYARPKLTTYNNPIADHTAPENIGDGGFLSYNTTYNDFITTPLSVLGFDYPTPSDPNDGDGGSAFTKSKQYPYYNFSKVTTKGDMEEYREWVLPVVAGSIWYVDGRGIGATTKGWGQDASHEHGWGDYPDKPKQTLTRNNTATGEYGIFHDPKPSLINQNTFNPAKDIIFVVGPVQALLEKENLNEYTSYPLHLYRYPGGHKLSNGLTDATTTANPSQHVPTNPNTYTGLATGLTDGPGANLGAMINANQTSSSFVMENVVVDGLYKEGAFTTEEILMYNIPTSYNTEKSNVSEPLVVTTSGAQLTLKGNTILQHGYNNTDAATTWYYNPDYTAASNVHDGGALYVAPDIPASGENPAVITTVNVEGLVTITGNKQKNGGTECNVYLPTFNKYLNMTNAIAEDTRIGVTSPIRNRADSYSSNTFSPIAVAVDSEHAADTAKTAWRHHNFYDDQGWFFVNGHTADSPRSTFYSGNTGPTVLNFGWTWANVVRKEPEAGDLSGDVTNDFAMTAIDSPHDLAWLISLVNGGNDLSGSPIKLTADINLEQYIWVPIGIEGKPFSGTFDGQGHLIKKLSIEYLGTGSLNYEYANFGMFGNLDGGTLDRTFVVDGFIWPRGDVNIGGLAGLMQGSSVISNSEAAATIHVPDRSAATAVNYTGGLVGNFLDGEIHSSMAMPSIYVDKYYAVGGLVGSLGSDSGTAHELSNSFAHPQFVITDGAPVIGGGLAGVIDVTGSMKNCYARLQASTNLTTSNYGSLVYNSQGAVDNCFGFKDDKDGDDVYSLAGDPTSSTPTNSYYFSAVESSDTYGYLYTDNQLYDWDGSNWTKADTCLFIRLNSNAMRMNKLANDSIYAHWTRPTISEINGDYPVLMLCNYNTALTHPTGQGEFRSMASYGSTKALQYGGPARDGNGNQLNGMLAHMTTADGVFVYGDVTTEIDFSTNPAKIAIHEDAAILDPGDLSTSYANTYVGVTFDNSARHTSDINGLARDWHMFGTPLQAAPLGINYTDTNENNPYADPPVSPVYDFYAAGEQDGYFPSTTPYAEYDFYCFNEYTYWKGNKTIGSPQWINFKRNGNSHYYSQGYTPYNHAHIDYYAYDGGSPGADANVNEPTLIQGKGYMMAIQANTFMQSHGTLNGGAVSINVTNKAVDAEFGGKSQNLISNPFHAYLDFYRFAKNNGTEWTSVNDGCLGNAYYVYDADHGYYKSYTAGSSKGGEYADRYIHPHQGFVVTSTAANQSANTITFEPSMFVTREVAGDIQFRDDDRPAYPLVNLYADDYQGHSELLVIEFERPENGGGLKAKGLRSGNHLMYAHNGNNDYCAFFAKVGTDKVPVRFKTFEDGVFTMHWNTANGDFHGLYLIDNLTGTTCDMLKNDSYTFNALTSDYLSRFYIVFDVTDVEEYDEHHNFAFFDGNEWIVNGTGHFDLIDMTGRVLYSTEFVNEQNRINLSRFAEGIYMMRLSNYQSTKTIKIVNLR